MSMQSNADPRSFSMTSTARPSISAASTMTSSTVVPRRRTPLVYPALLSRVADIFRERLPLSDREKDGLLYKAAFTGTEAVDMIAYIMQTTDRNLALLLGRSLDAQKFFHDVTYDHRLRDSGHEVYQFRETLLDENSDVNGVFTLTTECYSPTCTPDRLCYSIACPKRVDQQKRLNMKPQAGLKREDSRTSLHEDQTDEQKLWINTVPKEVSDSVSDREKKRQEVISEICYTERDFVKDLEYLQDFWVKPLRAIQSPKPSPIPEHRREKFVRTVFANCAEIYSVNKRLADSLTRRQQENPVVHNVGDILLNFIPHFNPFITYGANQLNGKYEFEREKQSNPAFGRFADETERLKESRKLELNGYLTKPTTRLARYPLLLENIHKYTADDNPDKEDIPKAIKGIRNVLSQVNVESGKSENRFTLMQLSQQLVYRPGEHVDLQLTEENRKLIMKVILKKSPTDSTGDITAYLFDHAILFVRPKIVNKREELKVFKRPIPLGLLMISQMEEVNPRMGLAKRPSSGLIPGARSNTSTTRQEQGHPITFKALGKGGYEQTLYCSSQIQREKLLKAIGEQQSTLNSHENIFTKSNVNEGFFTGPLKHLVCCVKSNALSATIKVFKPMDAMTSSKKKSGFAKMLSSGQDVLKVFKEFYIPTETYSIHFLRSSLCVGCAKGFEIVTLDDLVTQPLLDQADTSLDFVAMKENLKPIYVERLQRDFLLCYSDFSFFVNKHGWRARPDWKITWEGTPESFAIFNQQYILAFEPNFIETRSMDTGMLVHIQTGKNVRMLHSSTREVAAALRHLAAEHLVIGAETRLPFKRPRANGPLLRGLGLDLGSVGRVETEVVPSLRNVVLVDNAEGRVDAAGIKCARAFADVLEDGGRGERSVKEELSADEVVNIQFTSGTTSAPKAAALTHRSILNNGASIGDRMLLTAEDVVCCPPPLFHCFGSILGYMATATHGSAIVFPAEAFDPLATLQAVQEYRCTALYGVPTMFIAELELLASRTVDGSYGFDRLRTGIAAGSSVPAELMRKLHRTLNLTELTICYGMTETSPVSVMTTTDDPLEKRVGTVGRLLPHITGKVVDPVDKKTVLGVGERGELAVSGYSVMKGYWGDQERTDEVLVKDEEDTIFMLTGDEASMDAEGYVTITGRIKDIIIRGGENIHPLDIENCLLGHEAVENVSCVGVPDERYGEVVAVFVIKRKEASIAEDELRIWVREHLAGHFVPKHVFWTEDLPKTPSGKVQKFKLREEALDLLKEKQQHHAAAMRLRLHIQRHELPPVKILFKVPEQQPTPVSKLLEWVNVLVPLESDGWGLEDYSVSVSGFECLHYLDLHDVLSHDDQVYIRALQTNDIKARIVSGRMQISNNGVHLLDGVPFGRQAIRRLHRPAVYIPPLKRRRLTQDQDDDAQGDQEPSFQIDDGVVASVDGAAELVPVGEIGGHVVTQKKKKRVRFSDESNNHALNNEAWEEYGEDDEDADEADYEPSDDSEDEDSDDVSEGNEGPSGAVSDSEDEEDTIPSQSPKRKHGQLELEQAANDGASSNSSDLSSSSDESDSEVEITNTPSETLGTDHIQEGEQALPPLSGSAPGKGTQATRARNKRRAAMRRLTILKVKCLLPEGASLADLNIFEAQERGEIPSNFDVYERFAAAQTQPKKTADTDDSQLSQTLRDTANYSPHYTPMQLDDSFGGNRFLQGLAASKSTGSNFRSIPSDDEPPEEMSAMCPVASAISQTASLPESQSDSILATKKARLDVLSSRRLLFGSLGVRNPRSKEEEDKLRVRLAAKAAPKSRGKRALASTTAETSGPEPDVSNDMSDAWKSRVNLTAVECVEEGIILSSPPFPFYQRWDPQQQYQSKKSKRQSQSHYDETAYADEEEWAGLDYDDAAPAVESSPAEEEYEQDGDDLPTLPEDLTKYKTLERGDCEVGAIIAFNRMEASQATGWLPGISPMRMAAIEAFHDGTLSLTLAKRDCPKAEYDKQGNRVYSKFEMPDDDGDQSAVEVDFEDLAQAYLVRSLAAADTSMVPDSVPLEFEIESMEEDDVLEADSLLTTDGTGRIRGSEEDSQNLQAAQHQMPPTTSASEDSNKLVEASA
ncbi:hypothetical protein FH972_025186 [Carpinus fangiana]|uniref:Uncharacterized protein n=1 Tax=Carpinus fangiana TaxID=176857 RepID=A0A5N6L0A0_9ROSI|nr:hypothetical protein FH972_025186 [Carpinus fangiana]